MKCSELKSSPLQLYWAWYTNLMLQHRNDSESSRFHRFLRLTTQQVWRHTQRMCGETTVTIDCFFEVKGHLSSRKDVVKTLENDGYVCANCMHAHAERNDDGLGRPGWTIGVHGKCQILFELVRIRYGRLHVSLAYRGWCDWVTILMNNREYDKRSSTIPLTCAWLKR